MNPRLKLLALVATMAMSVPVVPGVSAAPLMKPAVADQTDVQNVQFRRGGWGSGWGNQPVWRPPVTNQPILKPYGAPGAGRPWVESKPQPAPRPGYDINGGKGQLNNTFNEKARQQEALRQLFNALSSGRF